MSAAATRSAGESAVRNPLPGLGYTTRQARAHVALWQAIQDQVDDGVLTPCRADPQTWDADDTDSPIKADIQLPARLCRTACPVFELCAAFVATDPPVHGIVAGQFRRHPRDPRHYSNWAGRPDQRAIWAAEAGTDAEEAQAA